MAFTHSKQVVAAVVVVDVVAACLRTRMSPRLSAKSRVGVVVVVVVAAGVEVVAGVVVVVAIATPQLSDRSLQLVDESSSNKTVGQSRSEDGEGYGAKRGGEAYYTL